MKFKKVILGTLSLILIFIVMLQSNVFGYDAIYMGIVEKGETDWGYAIGDPNNGGSQMWNTVKYQGASASSGYNRINAYCARAGQGFGSTTGQANKGPLEYKNGFDMVAQKDTILSSNILATANTVINDTSVKCYDAILALADLVYLKENTSAEKENLIRNALEKYSEYEYDDYTYKITNDDIIAVQQAAMWYFTNYDQPEKYNLMGNTHWLWYIKENDTTFRSLNEYKPNGKGNNDEGPERTQQAEALYKYLINTAITNASNSNYVVKNNILLYTNLNALNETQPIIIIEKGEDKEFDLALRKYITKINGEEVKNTRVPSIDLANTLDSGKETASYEHRKDPVTVKKGSVVTYKLTIYNEGEKLGRATKIIDQLPEGLEFSRIVSGNFKQEAYNENASKNSIQESYNSIHNRLVLVRKDNNEDNLNPYTTGELDSETIEIECIVTADSDSKNKKILTNVAWIAEEYNAEDNITITNQKGLDIDSEPEILFEEELQSKIKISYANGNTNSQEGFNQWVNIWEEVDIDTPSDAQIIEYCGTRYFKKYSEKMSNIENPEYIKKQYLNGTIAFKLGKKYMFGLYSGGNRGSYGTISIENTSTNPFRTNAYNFEPIDYKDFLIGINGSTPSVDITDQHYKDENNNFPKLLEIFNEGEVYIPFAIPTKQDLVTSDNGYIGNSTNITDLTKPDYFYQGQQDDDDFEKIVLEPKEFDLKLIKRITAVNGITVPERIKNVDITKLANGTQTTADYDLDKTPVAVKKGDIVTYTLRVYNEGEIDGYAAEITENIPQGLEFLWSTKEGEELEADTTLTEAEKKAIEYNQEIWNIPNEEAMIKTDYLSKEKEVTEGSNLIKAFDSTKEYSAEEPKNPDYKEVSVMLKVVSEDTTGKIIRNEACISKNTDKNGETVKDRDSDPEEWVKYEDDEDYDNIILKSFDLALRKFIVAVSKDETIENTEYMKNDNGTYTRAPKVDTSKLNTTDEDGKLITTAIYEHTKEPVQVQKGDYVVYMLRVYNEGNISGYAAEIKDHLPEYLEYVEGEYNKKYGWEVSEDGRLVTTKYLSDDKYLLEATTEKNGKIELDYKDVPILCKVKDTAKTNEKITNIADITVYEDEQHEQIKDRDSNIDNVKLPEDKDLPSYNDNKTEAYIPGQEDDDDFEKVIIKRFDLALRKFITKVEDKEITTRIPQVKYEDGQISYEHTKEPVDVVNGNTVIYTLRVYNEGEINGYASVVTDDVPEGLEFLPENSQNKEMRWVMYEELAEGAKAEDEAKVVECDGKKYIETQDAKKASIIRTDYLSKEQGEARMKEDDKENPNLIKAFDGSKEITQTNPDYKDLKIAFKVVEPNGSDRILINYAQISDDTDEYGKPVDDDDSTPDKWNDGEDDQDIEKIRVPIFDLALRKWVTQAIVIEDGKETVTNTGHQPYDDPEGIVKVELNRKKLDSLQVKFRYSIRVINEGQIEGYAKEVTDYIPEGLKFVAEDNPGWTDKGNNVISTRLLENTLLKPGEYADIEVLLTWINGKDNMGLKTNTAEISEDYNEKGIPDKDSTPNNKKPGEDDIDDAPVMLSISTGQMRTYFVLGLSILITISGGIILIKKYVL